MCVLLCLCDFTWHVHQVYLCCHRRQRFLLLKGLTFSVRICHGCTYPVRHLGALSSWLPRTVLQWPRECKCLFKIPIPNSLDVCPEVWFPYSCGSSILIFWGNFILFWQFAIPTITYKGSFSEYIFKRLSLENKNVTIIVQGEGSLSLWLSISLRTY